VPVLLDSAYQGFATGDFYRDGFALRLFRQHVPFMLAQSFAKNMGLYGQRVGAASIQCENPDQAKAVLSQMKLVIRGMYSNPPLHGVRIAEMLLTDKELRQQWYQDVKTMADRIKSMRQLLVDELQKAGSKRSWKHITDQVGMFCFTGLTPEECEKLQQQHIYMARTGRIAIPGITTNNVAQVAKAIHDVTK